MMGRYGKNMRDCCDSVASADAPHIAGCSNAPAMTPIDKLGMGELLARVKAATGPDRELDILIECATGPFRPWSKGSGMVVPLGEPDYWVFTNEQADKFIAAYPKLQDRYALIPKFGFPFFFDPEDPTGLYGKGFASIHKNASRRTVSSYSASIDAALALTERMLPGWLVSLDQLKSGWLATLVEFDREADLVIDDHDAEGVTAPLAILAALLTALSLDTKGDGV